MRAPDFWYPRTAGRLSMAAQLLRPLGWLYGAGGALKASLSKPMDPGVPVICIGNVTAGGTGKTPLAIDLAGRLTAAGHSPFFLTRGYGGREAGPVRVDPARHEADDVGDEPLLLARSAPVIVARQRPEGARVAVAEGADVIIMDDGFQNPSLAKRRSILVVDSETLFGNGLMIPAGPLREPVRRGLARADAVVLMGRDTPQAEEFAHTVTCPVFSARLEPDTGALETLHGRPYLAFAGIGRPDKVFATARSAGLSVAATRAFPDHHAFSQSDLSALKRDAAALGAGLLTTEKDAVRLPPDLRSTVRTLPVRAVFQDEARYDAFARGLLGGRGS